LDGGSERSQMLSLEHTEQVRIPLSSAATTSAVLSASEDFPLDSPDTRTRSYRVVNIDFK
jgi:hypothetical protein